MDSIEELKLLAGVKNRPLFTEYKGYPGSNISVTGDEKGQLMKKHDIRPGTPEWFRLWFTLPYLTNTSPLDPKFKQD